MSQHGNYDIVTNRLKLDIIMYITSENHVFKLNDFKIIQNAWILINKTSLLTVLEYYYLVAINL
jgi:hypothetical protein